MGRSGKDNENNRDMFKWKRHDRLADKVAGMSEREYNALLRKYYERTLFITGISIGLSFAAVLITVCELIL